MPADTDFLRSYVTSYPTLATTFNDASVGNPCGAQQVSSIEELNGLLEEACWRDLGRTIAGQGETVGQRREQERVLLGELPRERFATWEEATPRIDATALAPVRRNRYSVPASLAGLRIRARIEG